MKSILQIQCDISELATLEAYVQDIEENWKLSAKQALELNLVLDELITNIIEHGGRSPQKSIEIILTLEESAPADQQLTITVTDNGPPFDPTQGKDPDTSLSLDKRKCGGLGILLVRKFSDGCGYKRRKGKNIFTIIKSLTRGGR